MHLKPGSSVVLRDAHPNAAASTSFEGCSPSLVPTSLFFKSLYSAARSLQGQKDVWLSVPAQSLFGAGTEQGLPFHLSCQLGFLGREEEFVW